LSFSGLWLDKVHPNTNPVQGSLVKGLRLYGIQLCKYAAVSCCQPGTAARAAKDFEKGRIVKRIAGYLFLVCALCQPRLSAQDRAEAVPRPLAVEDMFQLPRAGGPSLDAAGTWVAWSESEITDSQQNKSRSRLWVAPADGSAAPRMLTNGEAHDGNPRWSPDSRWILFESDRSGSSQLWVISSEGGEARQLTHVSTGASGGIWSPDGRRVAFVSAVWPEFSTLPFRESDELNAKQQQMLDKSPVRARVFNRLFYRHWNSYVENKRQHLFVMDVTGDSGWTLEVSEPRDVTPGDRDASPTSFTFGSAQDYTFSPDGSHVVFTATPEKGEAWSTNSDLCRVSADGGSETWETLTDRNPAADAHPVFSRDGRFLAWRAHTRAGFEADKWQVMVCACSPDGSLTEGAVSLTEDLDLSFDEIVWLDDEELIVTTEVRGERPIMGLSRTQPNQASRISGNGSFGGLQVSADGRVLVARHTRMTHPARIVAGGLDQDLIRTRFPQAILSTAGADLLSKRDLREPMSVEVTGADGDKMQMWILTPPGFDPQQKWPLAFLVHGGPQGAWTDGWSFRWNPQLWAAQGYVVACPNPRGSTGFGQKYTDQISGDWGGRCYNDLMAGLDWLEDQQYIDGDRMFAAGASFGGYMMNWFQGHTDRFQTLITHCGVYNFDSMYGTTEELWFVEYENGGVPWGPDRTAYEKHSPHLFAANFKTPMLIIHNDLDFRVPVSEGIQLFTALQRQGVPSRFINFPDEGHWVNKPANSRYWHQEIFSWLKQYCPPGPK
jgi:dipeptidyl aminopeptidase/acylaminoacyl peptidase